MPRIVGRAGPDEDDVAIAAEVEYPIDLAGKGAIDLLLELLQLRSEPGDARQIVLEIDRFHNAPVVRDLGLGHVDLRMLEDGLPDRPCAQIVAIDSEASGALIGHDDAAVAAAEQSDRIDRRLLPRGNLPGPRPLQRARIRIAPVDGPVSPIVAYPASDLARVIDEPAPDVGGLGLDLGRGAGGEIDPPDRGGIVAVLLRRKQDESAAGISVDDGVAEHPAPGLDSGGLAGLEVVTGEPGHLERKREEGDREERIAHEHPVVARPAIPADRPLGGNDLRLRVPGPGEVVDRQPLDALAIDPGDEAPAVRRDDRLGEEGHLGQGLDRNRARRGLGRGHRTRKQRRRRGGQPRHPHFPRPLPLAAKG